MTGQWLAVTPSTFNGTELSAQEFRDALFLRYGRSPGDLPSHCDGCGQKFTIQHALECKKGGKVILRHNELRDEIGNLAANAFICGKPIRSRADQRDTIIFPPSSFGNSDTIHGLILDEKVNLVPHVSGGCCVIHLTTTVDDDALEVASAVLDDGAGTLLLSYVI
jgi:hypothetical protein